MDPYTWGGYWIVLRARQQAYACSIQSTANGKQQLEAMSSICMQVSIYVVYMYMNCGAVCMKLGELRAFTFLNTIYRILL